MSPIPELGASPYQEEHVQGPWRVVVRSEVGLARSRMEDAWKVCLDVNVCGRPYHALAVFDGLGGLPRGQEAAWAAADRLEDALRNAKDLDAILPRLNRVVRETGGATTAVVALLDLEEPGTGELLCVGDSAAYSTDHSGIRMLTVKDSVAPHVLSDFLGNIDLKGHRIPFHLEPEGALILCTDGVDGVADPARLKSLISRNGESAAALEELFTEINARGAPDNATLLVAYRAMHGA